MLYKGSTFCVTGSHLLAKALEQLREFIRDKKDRRRHSSTGVHELKLQLSPDSENVMVCRAGLFNRMNNGK